MANISLEGSIRTCKIDVGWANKLESDRFLNPTLMVCPPWNGVDNAGRRVCPDSFTTKTAGCNSPDDRIEVENALRPQYIEYVNLDADGIRGDLYSQQEMYQNSLPFQQEGKRSQALYEINNISGNFGKQFGADVYPKCSNYTSVDAQAQINKQQRMRNQMVETYKAYKARQGGGMMRY